jgi:microcystin-dependent protein
MPSHNHNAIVFNGGGGPLTGNVQGTFGGPDFGPLVAGNATQSAGSNFPHNNIPPFQAVNFIIKT